MARQKTYSTDSAIQGADRLTGIRSENSNTANYTIDDIAEFLANTGNADGSRLGWRYDYGGEYDSENALQPGKMYIQFLDDAETKDFANIRTIYFKNLSKDDHSIVPIRGQLAGGILKIANTSTPGQRDYAIYRVTTSAAVSGSTDESFMTLLHIASDGTFGADELVISPFQSGIGVESEGVVLRSGTLHPEGNEVGLQGDFYIQYEVVDLLDDVPLRLFGPKASSDGAANWGDGVSMRGLAATLDIDNTRTFTVPPKSDTEVGDAVVEVEGTNTDRTIYLGIPSGLPGSDGEGFTGGEYDPLEGRVTFTSDDGLGFQTEDLRGANGLGVESATFVDGVLTIMFDDPNIPTIVTPDLIGEDGTDGSKILIGEGNPMITDGVDGDIWIDSLTSELYGPKVGPNWSTDVAVDLRGLQGLPGIDGDGITSADFTNGVLTIVFDDPDIADIVTPDLRPVNGTDGKTILNGIIPPVDTEGEPGDFFFDTVGDKFYGPKDADDTWDLTKVIDLSPIAASISVEEVGVTPDDKLSTLDCIKFTGSGVVSVLPDPDNDDCVIVTIAGGGAVVVEQVEDLSLDFVESTFTEDAFDTDSQTVTFTNSWTAAADYTVTSLTLSSDDALFADVPISSPVPGVTIPNQTFTVSAAGTTFTLTLVYDDADGVSQTRTNTVTLRTMKSDPDLLLSRSFDSFVITPDNNRIENYDAGNVVYTLTENDLEEWELKTATAYAEVGDGTFVGNTLQIEAEDSDISTTVTTVYQNPADADEEYTDLEGDTFTRVTSFRYGSVASTSKPSWVDSGVGAYGIRNLAAFTGDGRTIRSFNPAPLPEITITPAVGDYLYFALATTQTISSISISGGPNIFGNSSVITAEPTGDLTVYTLVNPASYTDPVMIQIS